MNGSRHSEQQDNSQKSPSRSSTERTQYGSQHRFHSPIEPLPCPDLPSVPYIETQIPTSRESTDYTHGISPDWAVREFEKPYWQGSVQPQTLQPISFQPPVQQYAAAKPLSPFNYYIHRPQFLLVKVGHNHRSSFFRHICSIASRFNLRTF